ncbi:MAG: hypothetical protein F6K39_47365, partial [Okeania sp. SIO3B3]|nr:hypothetical protein [Okeania sp. SIO3B3]
NRKLAIDLLTKSFGYIQLTEEKEKVLELIFKKGKEAYDSNDFVTAEEYFSLVSSLAFSIATYNYEFKGERTSEWLNRATEQKKRAEQVAKNANHALHRSKPARGLELELGTDDKIVDLVCGNNHIAVITSSFINFYGYSSSSPLFRRNIQTTHSIFCDDDKMLLYVTENSVESTRVSKEDQTSKSLMKLQKKATSIAFSKSKLVIGDNDGEIYLINTKTDLRETPLVQGNTKITFLTFAPKGVFFASKDTDNKVRLWSNLFRLCELEGKWYSVAYLSDTKIVTGGHKKLCVWNWSSEHFASPEGEEIYHQFEDDIKFLTCNTNVRLLAAADSKGKIVIWNTDKLDEPLGTVSVKQEISHLRLANDGSRLFIGLQSRIVQIKDIDQPKTVW